LIYVFSALVILSLAIGYIIGSAPQAVPQDASGSDPGVVVSTPAPSDQNVEESNTSEADPEEAESTSEATSEPDAGQ
jgi:hypothetical protein